jgi:hypothetical protein
VGLLRCLWLAGDTGPGCLRRPGATLLLARAWRACTGDNMGWLVVVVVVYSVDTSANKRDHTHFRY